MKYADIQKEEARTWLEGDADKKQREIIRYPLLAKQMGLSYLDTSDMVVADVGAGPFGGVSSVLRCKKVNRFDPLTNEYGTIADITTYSDIPAEEIDYKYFDLIISTNAIDHFEDPTLFFNKLTITMKPGAYFAHFHAINNAITHPHLAHVHNINPEMVRMFLKDDFEEVWYMDYQHDGLTYAWRKQPAFSGLYRKVTGYGK